MIKYVRFFKPSKSEWIPAFKAFCFWIDKDENNFFEYKYYDGKNFEEIFSFFNSNQEKFKGYLEKGIIIIGELITKEEIDERFFEKELIFKCELNDMNILTNIKPLNLFEGNKLSDLESNKKIKLYNL